MAARKPSKSAGRKTTRVWLMFPPRLITRPIIWEVAMKYHLVPNVRQAEVRDEIGIVCLELAGKPADITKGVAWLEKHGVKVEPVEINVIES